MLALIAIIVAMFCVSKGFNIKREHGVTLDAIWYLVVAILVILVFNLV